MEFKTYTAIDDFKNNYWVDYERYKGLFVNFLDYLNSLYNHYDKCAIGLLEYGGKLANATDDIDRKKEIYDYQKSALLKITEINKFIQLSIEREKTIIELGERIAIKDEVEPYEKEIGQKNIPYKLVLLRELGLMDILKTKYDNNSEQLYRILDFITGGKSKEYYLSMYGNNYKGKNRVNISHTAYLRKIGLLD